MKLLLVMAFAGTIALAQGSWLPAKIRGASPSVRVKRCTFNTTPSGANVATNQANFPIAVSINSSSWPSAAERSRFFAPYNVGGKRVRFLDADRVTLLSYEVEYFDLAGQQALYWVKVPQIDGNSSADGIFVSYGSDPYGVNQDGAASVWSSSFLAVYHLGEGTAANAIDSAGSNVATATGTTEAAGILARARSFNGTSDVIIRSSLSSSLPGALTISAWLSASVPPAYQARVADLAQAAGSGLQLCMAPSGQLLLENSGGPTTGIATPDSKVDGQWHAMATVRSGTTYSFYANGSAIGASGGTAPTYTRIALGRYIGTSSAWYPGLLDEVRISSVARSADWLRLEYFSINKTAWNGDGWLSWSAEQPL